MRRLASFALLILGLAVTVRAAEVDDLLKKLKATDPDARRAAIRALAEAGADAKTVTPVLIQSLRDKDSFVRRFAAEALGAVEADPKVAIPALTLALRDKRKEGKEAAAGALGRMGPNAVRPLLDVLKDANAEPQVRRKAAEALGKIGPPAKSAIPALVESLGAGAGKAAKKGPADMSSIRVDVVNALGEIATANDKNVVSALQGIMVRRDPGMQQAIRSAVKKIQNRK